MRLIFISLYGFLQRHYRVPSKRDFLFNTVNINDNTPVHILLKMFNIQFSSTLFWKKKRIHIQDLIKKNQRIEKTTTIYPFPFAKKKKKRVFTQMPIWRPDERFGAIAEHHLALANSTLTTFIDPNVRPRSRCVRDWKMCELDEDLSTVPHHFDGCYAKWEILSDWFLLPMMDSCC